LIALIIDAHRSAAARRRVGDADTSIERPFASNISENIAVKRRSRLAARFSWPKPRKTIGYASSSR
jgi:hypothetical protein